ncbi:MAG: signal peptidase I, partial [Coriobacteriia bacterium]|nr:signal peptidase I [Coriobacteriia bacterium]
MANNPGNKRTGGHNALATLCNVFGVLLLVAVIGLCAPLTIPMIAGYQVYDVVSGSMEPEIPVGSAVYVKATDPVTIEVGDVIAYQDEKGVVSHRVTVNRTSLGEFVTKGDANDVEDLHPIPYDAVLGRVEMSIPGIGAFMAIYASTAGKVYLLLIAACGVMLNVLAGRMRERANMRRRELEAAIAATGAVSPGGAPVAASYPGQAPAPAPRKTRSIGTRIRHAVMAVLAVVFVGSGAVVGYALYQYNVSDALYSDASDQFTGEGGRVAPKSVDFAALQKKNPDVVGWIYCEGTPINYPVLKGDTNDTYLHNDYTGNYNIDGSIFVDADNTDGFIDSNTIIYGHHMNSGAMFACLEKWADQKFYDEHPVIWLLTPTQDYKIVLFSGHHVSAHSSWYDIITNPGEQMNQFLAQAQAESDFKADVG